MHYANKVADRIRKGTPYYSNEFKQHLVAASHQPGASLSSVARANGVSTSALFRWRKEYPPLTSETLLPIMVASAKIPCGAIAGSSAPREVEAIASGLIEITFKDASIRVSGLVDSNALRMVLEHCR